VLCACGRFGFGEGTARDDGPVVGSDIADIDAPPPDALPPTGPFGTAVPVAALNTGSSEDDPALTGDQLEIVFNSDRAGGVGAGDIWTAKRASLAAAWGTATNVTALNTAGDDATPSLSRDGLQIFWTANGSVGSKDVFMSTRASRLAAWGPAVELTAISTTGDDAGPSLSADGLELYFASDLGGNENLYVAKRAAITDAFTTASQVTELNTASPDQEPWVNGTKSLLVWTSSRVSGNNDLWLARRSDPASMWGTAAPISELNTAAAEGDPWLSPDETTIYFARGTDIFTATR
jgi:Tol biopolymer transport system component